jgi:glycosyltransferase involved in cell wall biosynthesis
MIGAKRAARMASGMAARGWEVRVVSVRPGFYDRTDETLDGNAAVRTIRTLTLSPLVVGRRLRRRLRGARGAAAGPAGGGGAVPAPPAWRKLFATPDEHAGWIPPALVAGVLRGPRPDVVLSSAPPFSAHVAAAVLARLRGSRLALDYRDPWTTAYEGSLADSGRVPTPRLEAWCVRRAAVALATTESIAASLRRLRPERVAVIPNGIDTAALAGLEALPFPRFTILYAGTFYGSRSAGPVLRALQRIKSAGRLPAGGVGLHVMGIASGEVRREAVALGVEDCLTTEEFQPYRRAMARMKGADLLLLVVGAEHGGMVPAKLFEYLAAGRPILAIGPRGSEAGAILAEAGAGDVLEADDVDGIAHRIVEAAAGAARVPSLPERYTTGATMDALDRVLRGVL